ILRVLLAAIRFEVHADEGIGTHLPAEVHELAGSYLVRLDAAPQEIDHGWPRLTWTDALSPPVEICEDPAPPHHRRSELLRHRHDIVAPPLGDVIPGGFNGSIGG